MKVSTRFSVLVLATLCLVPSCGKDKNDDSDDTPATDGATDGAAEPGLGKKLSEYAFEKRFEVKLPKFADSTSASLKLLDVTEELKRSRYCKLKEDVRYFKGAIIEPVAESFCDGTAVEVGKKYKITRDGGVDKIYVKLAEASRLVTTRCTASGTKDVYVINPTENVETAFSSHLYYYGTMAENPDVADGKMVMNPKPRNCPIVS